MESVYGKGSEFTVRLPQKIVSAEPAGDFCTAADRSSERIKYRESFTAPDARILITDDNKSNLMVAEGLLKPTQIKIDCASSGAECINRLRSEKYDVIFLDHMMPEMDGIETLRRIREEGLAAGTPVVALTANAVSGARDMYLDYGFKDYLAKPIAGKSLEKMLLKLLPCELVHMNENVPYEKAVPAENSSSLIDKALGISYCGDSEELYIMMLHTYCEEFQERTDKLCSLYDRKDTANYCIAVHSLKSTSLNIGARELSDEARFHESAAKKGDIETIAADFNKPLENYKAVNDEAQKLLGKLEKKA